jgi:hypothetical protein
MTTILIKKKDTAGAPAPGDLTNAAGGAEIAVNTATKRLYTKDSGGTVVELGTNPSALTTNLLFSPDATYDIGASGATRPRDMYLSRNLTVGGTLTLAGGVNLNGNVTVGDSSADTLTINSTITSNLIFTDNTYDIGASGATRPRSMFLGTNLTVGGLGSFGSNVAVGGTATAWTGAYALSVGTLSNFGQRTGGNADLVMSWDAKWSGGTSGAGYTYISTGDVASAYEQNGSHRFYTTPTAGTAGGAISFPVRLAISAAGYTYVGYQGSALANLNILTGGQGGGVQLIRNTSGTSPTNGQSLGTLAWKGQDSANSNAAAEAMIEAVAAENQSGSTAATNMLFYVKNTGVGPGSSPSIAGAVNYLGQWVFGGATATPDGNSKLTLYTSSSAGTGLTIYEQTTGNNARLRLSQTAGAVVYDATYSSGANSHVFQIGSGTVATLNSSGNLLFATAANYNTIGMPQASGGYGISWERYGNIFGEYSSGATYISSNYYPTQSVSGYKTSTTATYGAAGISINGTGGPSNGGQITFLADLPTAKTAGNAFSPTSMGSITGYGTTLQNYSGHGTNAVLYLNNGYGSTGDTTACIKMNLNGGTGGGYIWGYSGDTTWSHNSEYIAATGWIARDTVATQIYQAAGGINFYTNTGLTSGSGFTPTLRTTITSGGNMLQMTGRTSSAYGTVANVQEWTGQYTNLANGASFSLFAINNQYDMLCYDLNIFCSTGGFFSYKSAGVFGYNGFTNTVLGSTCAITITKTGTLYNETMTLTNGQGSTYTELTISLRVWGYGARTNVSTGGSDLITSSYLVRLN